VSQRSNAARTRTIALSLALLFVPAAHAGPPYQTDDPDPVPLHHYEAYLFSVSDTTSTAGTALLLPATEANWGAAPNLQLHIYLTLTSSFAPAGGPTYTGFGDTELGAKYRFIKETAHRPEFGVFPMIELPTGNADHSLGVGSTWYRFPLWAQKSFGPWTTYGGGGAVIASGNGFKNFPFAGWMLQRDLTKKIALGGELYYHGSENTGDPGIHHALMADLGGNYNFTPGFQLLFAAGHSIKGRPETYSYLGLYWTWGHGPEDDDTGSAPDHADTK